ncbi:hypothetical protein CRYUN_Cryun18bG0122600 [Craigia yunnanensis]
MGVVLNLLTQSYPFGDGLWGAFGIEDSVQAAGPLLALLGFLLVPFIWSIPEALITAELGTRFPENGGYVVWVSSALGPYWGFQQGWMKWLSGVIDNALYLVLFLDYLKSAIPALEGGLPRTIAVLVLTLALTYMSYRGLTIVGWEAILLGVFSLLPFIFMGIVAIPKLKPSRWLVVELGYRDWGLYLNTLFWNLNYWDSISTLAGEGENPTAAPSNMGMFLPEMSSDSFQLEGMASRGMLPELFAKMSRYGTRSWDFILCISCFTTVMVELSRDSSSRELLILFWNDHGVYCICEAKDRPSSRIKAIQDTCRHGWSNFNVYSPCTINSCGFSFCFSQSHGD